MWSSFANHFHSLSPLGIMTLTLTLSSSNTVTSSRKILLSYLKMTEWTILKVDAQVVPEQTFDGRWYNSTIWIAWGWL